MTDVREPRECGWCGSEITGRVYRDRLGGVFCCRAHRDSSTSAVKRLLDRGSKPE